MPPHRIPNFVEKATRAGVVRVFIGLENINPDNLLAAGKKQNHIREYRQMLQMWKRHGAMIWTGYIIGFPNDTLDSVLRDIDVIKKELPIDILDLFMLTPLPGSADHLELLTKGAWMDPDMNKYDLHHRVAHHPVMADDEWEQAYVQSWKRFYTPEHMKTVVRRAAACDSSVHDTGFELMWFFITVHYEGVHPLDGGFFRLKFRRDRRPTLPRESALAFYPRYLAEIAVKTVKSAYWLAWMALFATSAERKASRRSYSDLALKSAADDDREELGLLAAR